jgi:hypothetical protein
MICWRYSFKNGIIPAMKILLRILFAAATLAISGTAHAQSRIFICPDNAAVTIAVLGQNAISVTPINDGTMTMQRIPGIENGYAKGEFSVQITPDQTRASFMLPNWGAVLCEFQPSVSADGRVGLRSSMRPSPELQRQPQINAAPPPDRFPMPGRSLGGIMRSEPRQDAPRVRSFAENEPLTIIDRGPFRDGYNWFAIRYPGGEGWQWGGIMCSKAPLAGILQQCAN